LRTLAFSIAAVLFLVVSFGRPSPAHAAKVAIVALDGDRHDAARAAVVDAVQRDHATVANSQVDAARKKIRGKKLSDAKIARLATTLSAEFVITGAVKKKGKTTTVSLVVHDRKGKAVGTATAAARGPLNVKFKDKLAADLGPLLTSVDEAPEPAQPETPAEPETPEPAPERQAEPEKPATPEAPVAFAEAPIDRHAALEVELGMPFIGRDLSFDERAGLTEVQRPTRYDGATVPALGLGLAVYPLLLGKAFPERAAAWRQLAVTLRYERVLELTSKSGGDEFDTTMQRFDIGVDWRLVLGHKATLPTFDLGVGYGQASFAIDNGSTDLGLPDTSESFVSLKVGARVPVMKKLALHASFAYLLVSDGGDLNAAAAYGSGSASGFDLDLGAEYLLTPHIPLRAGFRLTSFSHDFDGKGALSNDLDGDPSTVDVSGATEKILGGYVSIGYRM
jgi:hypothetical protein